MGHIVGLRHEFAKAFAKYHFKIKEGDNFYDWSMDDKDAEGYGHVDYNSYMMYPFKYRPFPKNNDEKAKFKSIEKATELTESKALSYIDFTTVNMIHT